MSLHPTRRQKENLGSVDGGRHARQAFDMDRAARRFHDRFQTEHAAFLGFIKGIPATGDREAYASLLLHRLMFLYFLQKRGFLDGDPDYLRRPLQRVQPREDNRHSFHRDFLVPLFHEGLARSVSAGWFDVHDLERAYPDIQIADQAFENLFDFLDAYHWRLDGRPLRADNEINPDVLGHLFEKYVNQKQMGAYYTKEDITGYIARNTIIPFLLDAAEKKCPAAFRPDGPLWRLLRDNPDRYIYPAVRHNVDNPLPPAVVAGIEDVSKRTGWSGPTTPEYGLPTETWREVVARRQRCRELRAKLRKGEIHAIDDLITHNLDILRFALDAIENCEGPELLLTFYQGIAKISVLDPTCGSGAFLFAALKVLEPLHDACLKRMAAFVEHFADFRAILAEAGRHPNRGFFRVKSIIVHNLHGVDIMEEAVEICKLRLFLELAARADDVKDLQLFPNLGFNIRRGNALVGFASRQEAEAKAGEREHLDRRLAGAYDIDADNPKQFADWRKSHRPFHWSAEFPAVADGFDVIIGNPPYLASRKVSAQYEVMDYRAKQCPDIYAWCLERVVHLLGPAGRSGMIVPLSLGFSEDFEPIRKVLFEAYRRNWFSSFGRIPSALFNYDVRVRNTIHLGAKQGAAPTHSTSRLHRWFEAARPHLFPTLEYFPFTPARWKFRVPKLNSACLGQALEDCLGRGSGTIADLLSKRPTPHMLYSKKTAYNWLAFSRKPPPCFDARGKAIGQTQLDVLHVSSESHLAPLLLLLNGKLAYIYWCVVGDDFHVAKWSFAEFPLMPGGFLSDSEPFARWAEELEREMRQAVSFKRNAGKKVGSFNLARCRRVTDKADRWFAEWLGLEAVLEDVELYCTQVVKSSFAE